MKGEKKEKLNQKRDKYFKKRKNPFFKTKNSKKIRMERKIMFKILKTYKLSKFQKYIIKENKKILKENL
jgi:hypothetical protein